MGGKVFGARLLWRVLTEDKWIHDIVDGNIFHFVKLPFQDALLRPLQFTTPDRYALDRAMLSFLQRRVVEKCDPSFGPGFYSNIFPVMKKDGTARVILNLKDFNEQIDHILFKMDTLKEVVQLILLDLCSSLLY